MIWQRNRGARHSRASRMRVRQEKKASGWVTRRRWGGGGREGGRWRVMTESAEGMTIQGEIGRGQRDPPDGLGQVQREINPLDDPKFGGSRDGGRYVGSVEHTRPGESGHFSGSSRIQIAMPELVSGVKFCRVNLIYHVYSSLTGSCRGTSRIQEIKPLQQSCIPVLTPEPPESFCTVGNSADAELHQFGHFRTDPTPPPP